MLRAAQSPNATVGQRLYAARHALGLRADEAANAAGVDTIQLLAAEAGEQLAPSTVTALENLIVQLTPTSTT